MQVAWGEAEGHPWAGGRCTPGCPGAFPAESREPGDGTGLRAPKPFPCAGAAISHPGEPEHRPTGARACFSSRNSVCRETLPRSLEMPFDYSSTVPSRRAAGGWPCCPCRWGGSGAGSGEGMESLKEPARARPSLTNFPALGPQVGRFAW